MWQALIGPITEIAGGWIKGKVEEQKVKQEVKLEKLRTDADWEARMADATVSSWKDEYLILVLTSPLWFIGYGVAVDNPEIIDRVQKAFATLAGLPEYYQYLLYAAVLASFGLKVKDMIKK